MHEFSLASSIRDIALETAAANHAVCIQSVHCRVGAMRQVVPSLMQTAFEACTAGTIAEGAKLVLEVDPVEVRCAACGKTSKSDEMAYQCPACESFDIAVHGGSDLVLTSIEIDQES